MNWIWPQCFLRNFDFRPYRSFWPKGPKQNSSSKLTKYLFSPKWNFEIGFARKTRFSSTFHGLRWPRLTERSASHPEAAPDSCFEPLRSSGMSLLVATLEQHQSAASSHFDKPLLATLKQHHTACIEPNRSSTTQLLRATSKQRQTSACYSEAALHRCYKPPRSSGKPLLATLKQHHTAASSQFEAATSKPLPTSKQQHHTAASSHFEAATNQCLLLRSSATPLLRATSKQRHATASHFAAAPLSCFAPL